LGDETGKHTGFGSWENIRQSGQNEEDLKRDTEKLPLDTEARGMWTPRLVRK